MRTPTVQRPWASASIAKDSLPLWSLTLGPQCGTMGSENLRVALCRWSPERGRRGARRPFFYSSFPREFRPWSCQAARVPRYPFGCRWLRGVAFAPSLRGLVAGVADRAPTGDRREGWDAAVEAEVLRSCAESGVPNQVEDATALAAVARILSQEALGPSKLRAAAKRRAEGCGAA